MPRDATKLRLGPANVYAGVKAKASMSTTLTGTNNDLTFRARRGGLAGNSITVAYVNPGTPSAAQSVVVVGSAITVNLRTDGASAIASTADEVRDGIRDSAAATSLVSVVRKSPDNGSGVVTMLAATALTGGSDTEVMTDMGYLGDGLSVNPSIATQPLTALQLGDVAVAEIVSGGGFRFTVPFKQIEMDVFEIAFPGAEKLDDGAGQRRLEFTAVVGQNQLEVARRFEIRRLTGVGESTNNEDILTIPLAAPVAGEAALAFGRDQQVVNANLRAFPDARGRLAYFGNGSI